MSTRPAFLRYLLAALLVAVVVTAVSTGSPGSAAGASPAALTLPAACDPATATDGLMPDGCYGPYPVHNYDINYSSGSAWDPGNWAPNFIGLMTQITFDVGTWFVRLAQWSVGWAFKFKIDRYNAMGIDISKGYSRGLVNNPRFQLFTLAYLCLIAYVGYNILRNKASMALGELIVSILLVALTGGLMANLEGYMNGTWRLMDGASASLLVAAQGEKEGEEKWVDPADATEADIDAAVKKVQEQIHEVFIAQPYDHINWSHSLKGTKCEAARNEALASGPHDNDDKPRKIMSGAGCDAEVAFNEKPRTSRLGGALLSMIASIVISVVVGGMGLTVVTTKFVAMLLFAVAPFIGLVAVFPGAGRRWGWLWLTTLVQAVVAVVGMSFLLSILLIGLEKTLEATADLGLVERFFVVIVLISVMSMARGRLLAGSQSTAGRFADNLTNVRAGGGGMPWQGPMGTGGANLGAAGEAFSNARRSAIRGTRLFVAQRMRERRAWHNIVKARRRGDRMAGIQHKTYYSDAPGGSHGPGPRYGFGDPAAGAGGKPRRGPSGGGNNPHKLRRKAVHQQMGIPIHRANQATSRGWTPESRYWRDIDRARRGYRGVVDKGRMPQSKAQDRYNEMAAAAAKRYRKATNIKPLQYPKPWTAAGRVTDREMREVPIRAPGGRRGRQLAQQAAAGQAAPRSRRHIRELIVQESSASWRFPLQKGKDWWANGVARRRGKRWARRRDLL